MTTPDNPGDGAEPTPQDWLCRAIVQEGRSAATRGLLHDFGNVMVGLCSISENAVDDIPEDSPLRDDMEIIRDSSMRAYQLIRRIVQLNAVDPAEPDMLECRSWMAAELESLRAVLPKGSDVRLDRESTTAFVRVREDALRDTLLVFALAASRRHRERLNLTLAVHKQDGAVVLEVREELAGDGHPVVPDGSPSFDLPDDYVDCCARKIGATGSMEYRGDGGATARLYLPVLNV